MQESEKKAFALASAPCLVVLGVACICGVLALGVVNSAFGVLGGLWSAIGRRFGSPQPAEITLSQALRDNLSAGFDLDPACDYYFTRGSLAGSSPEVNGGSGYQSDLTREQVVEAVQSRLAGLSFTTREGRLSLSNGAGVDFAWVDRDNVALRLNDEAATSEGVNTWSLQGVVRGSTFQGSYHAEEKLSSVVNGQGVERQTSLDADLSCPLRYRGGP